MPLYVAVLGCACIPAKVIRAGIRHRRGNIAATVTPGQISPWLWRTGDRFSGGNGCDQVVIGGREISR